MLEYAKTILPKVSDDVILFKKELTKCINWTNPAELQELHQWCRSAFHDHLSPIIEEVFKNLAA